MTPDAHLGAPLARLGIRCATDRYRDLVDWRDSLYEAYRPPEEPGPS